MNDKKVGETRIEKTVPARFSADETFDVGRDTGTAASSEYTSPFPFTGTLNKIEINLQPQDARSARATTDAERHMAYALAVAR